MDEQNFQNFIFTLGSNVGNQHTDKLCCDIYYYYHNKGFIPILLMNIFEILSIVFGLIFYVFFFILLDWTNLLQCGNNNCGDIDIYISLRRNLNLFEIIFLSIIGIYLLYKIIMFVPKTKNLYKIYNFFNNELEISSKDLQTMPWIEIISKITKSKIIANMHHFTNKIMRKNNYMIAMIDKKTININNFFYTKQLDMNLRFILLRDIRDTKEFLLTTSQLRNRFIFFGILNLIFGIFIFIIQIIYFFTSNIDDLYSNRNVLGPRRYTIIAKYKFREYNELPHFFEERINKSIQCSNDYTKQFESPVSTIIGKFIGLISGAFVGFFVIVSLLDESVLLYVRYMDRTLLFYMGVFTAISSFSKSLVRKPEESIYDPNGAMDKVVQHTHYLPIRWKGKCNMNHVKNEFLSLFPYKLIIFLCDLLSVITTPFIMIFTLSRQSKEIIQFIKEHSVYSEFDGNTCIFANITKQNEVDDTKMKKSLIFFNENHS